MSMEALVVTFIDENGYPVRKVFVQESNDPNRKTFETNIDKGEGKFCTIQVEIIPSIGTK